MSKKDYIIGDILIEIDDNHKNDTKDRLKAIRKFYGMTQKQISDMLDIPLDTWQQWERGRREPPKYIFNLIKCTLKYKMYIEKNSDCKETL